MHPGFPRQRRFQRSRQPFRCSHLGSRGKQVISEQLVDLSRLQFAATALYHFLFVPLTVGMVWLLVIMESVYVMTGNVIWKDMTRFWGKLFGINFALGVTTGITLEFQFGTNWAYYSHYVGANRSEEGRVGQDCVSTCSS